MILLKDEGKAPAPACICGSSIGAKALIGMLELALGADRGATGSSGLLAVATNGTDKVFAPGVGVG